MIRKRIRSARFYLCLVKNAVHREGDRLLFPTDREGDGLFFLRLTVLPAADLGSVQVDSKFHAPETGGHGKVSGNDVDGCQAEGN